MQKRLEDGEVDLVIQAIPHENVKDLIKDKGGSDIRKLFGKSADDTVTISRATWKNMPGCCNLSLTLVQSTLST